MNCLQHGIAATGDDGLCALCRREAAAAAKITIEPPKQAPRWIGRLVIGLAVVVVAGTAFLILHGR